MGAVIVALLLGVFAVPANAQVPSAVRRALREATVAVEPAGCAGVVAESRQLVLTARHCLDEGARSVRVRLSTGEVQTAWVVGTDRVADQAVLFLEEPVEVEPLAVTRRRQLEGTVLYFEGNPKRPRLQAVRLDRVGRCSSLPGLPNALFTTIKGQPGDSGAPVVDGLGRVVGLVHGGSSCQIATPADTLGRLVDRVLQRELVHADPRLRLGSGTDGQECRPGDEPNAVPRPAEPARQTFRSVRGVTRNGASTARRTLIAQGRGRALFCRAGSAGRGMAFARSTERHTLASASDPRWSLGSAHARVAIPRRRIFA